ncbi:MAG: hypothetical protein ACXAB4_09535 [Candidatus Hodarchaeales archaeon]
MASGGHYLSGSATREPRPASDDYQPQSSSVFLAGDEASIKDVQPVLWGNRRSIVGNPDIQKAHNLLGWTPKVRLAEGLESTIGWLF